MAESQHVSIGCFNVEITDDNLLGSGSFGTIYYAHEGNDKRNKTAVAKKIDLHKITDAQQRQRLRHGETLPIVKDCKHVNVVKFLDWQEIGADLWIVMEMCDCNLDMYSKHHDLSMEECELIAIQCADGLKYLHGKRLAHRDIKPNNILVDRTSQIVKYTDFSFAKDIDMSNSYMSTIQGNKFWLAPEMFPEIGNDSASKQFKKSVDLFSLGLVLVFVFVKKEAHPTFWKFKFGIEVQEDRDVLSHFEEAWRHSMQGKPIVQLIEAMLAKDPEVRPTAGNLAWTLRKEYASRAEVVDMITNNCSENEPMDISSTATPSTTFDFSSGTPSASPLKSQPSQIISHITPENIKGGTIHLHTHHRDVTITWSKNFLQRQHIFGLYDYRMDNAFIKVYISEAFKAEAQYWVDHPFRYGFMGESMFLVLAHMDVDPWQNRFTYDDVGPLVGIVKQLTSIDLQWTTSRPLETFK